MTYRDYSFIDHLCLGADQAIRALTGNVKTSGKAYPAKSIEEQPLTAAEHQHAAALMRVNHTGEICAQALYHGQGVVARTEIMREQMHRAAIEEGDHLAWCQQRLDELGSHPSYFNSLWYTGSFCLGLLAGMIGDPWSLGFVAETERQVVQHLEKHLHLLPAQDNRSQRILQQMESDEAKHRDEAIALGAKELPGICKKMMSLMSKVMVKTSYCL